MIRTICAILLVVSVGCGSDEGKSSGPIDIVQDEDAGNLASNQQTLDSGVTSPDSGGMSDAGGGLAPGCAYEGFEVATAAAEEGDRLLVTAETAGSPNRSLFFRYEDADLMPGTLEFDGSSFVDCNPCLFIQTGCVGEGCAETFQARDGSIELLQTSDTFRAELSGLRLTPVEIDDEGATMVIDGDAYCLDETIELTAPIEVDPCAGLPDPTFVDQNCGPAPLTVEFDLTAAAGEFERLDDVRVVFGDGESFNSLSETVTTHTYAAGEWDAEVIIRGVIANSSVTLESPVKIRAY